MSISNDGEIKDTVKELSGYYKGYGWAIDIVLNASGMYYGFARIGVRVLITADCETLKAAEAAAFVALASMFASMMEGAPCQED